MATKIKSTKGAPPRAALAEKPLTPRYENLAAYIEEQTGYAVSDPFALQLALALYGKFQKSDINREYLGSLASKREERENARAQRAADREARAAAREAKKSAAPAKKAAAKKTAKKSASKSNVTELPVKGKPVKKAARKAVKSSSAPF